MLLNEGWSFQLLLTQRAAMSKLKRNMLLLSELPLVSSYGGVVML